MRHCFIVLAALLTGCASSSQIPLDNTASGKKSSRFIVDDTRYYLKKGDEHFYAMKGDLFDPSPITKLDIDLSNVLDAESDKKSVRLKKMNIYFVYTEAEISARRTAGTVGVLTAGALGGFVSSAATDQYLITRKEAEATSDRQLVNCEFLARYKGHLIELTSSEPICENGRAICISSLAGLDVEDPMLKRAAAAAAAAHTCITRAITEIKKLQALPPLAENEQEIR